MSRELVPANDERLSRRAVLSAAGTLGSAALAGCSSLDGSLRSEVTTEEPGETTVRFFSGGHYVGNATYLLGTPYNGRVRFRPHVAHRVEGLSRFRLRFKPLLPPDTHFRVLLERPGGSPFPQYRFQSGEGYGWTLFEVPDLGFQSQGSFTVEFYIEAFDENVEPFGVATELELTFDNGLDPRTFDGSASAVVDAPEPGA